MCLTLLVWLAVCINHTKCTHWKERAATPSHICRKNCGETIDFVGKKRMITDVWICHPGRASQGNGWCNHQQRRACREAFTQINTHIHFFIKTQRSQDKDTKKTNRRLRTNGRKSRHPICLIYTNPNLNQKLTNRPCESRELFRVTAVSLTVFHKGSITYMYVDGNLKVINSHTVQLEPQQVSDVDRGHT